MILYLSLPGNVEPSSPPGPEFEDERDALLGNDDNLEEEEEGEGLFEGDFERYVAWPDSR